MTKKEAIEFIKTSGYDHFRYGDLSYMTEKKEALQDIENMEELAWNDGDIYGAISRDDIVKVTDREALIDMIEINASTFIDEDGIEFSRQELIDCVHSSIPYSVFYGKWILKYEDE